MLVIALYYLAGPQKVGRESRLFIGALISMCVIFTFIFTPFTVPDEDYHFSASHCLANFLMGDGYQSEDPVTMREDDAWFFQSLSSLLSSGSYNRAVNSAAGLFGDSKGNTEVITGRSHSITASMPQTKNLCSWNRVCKTAESVFLLAIRPWATFQFLSYAMLVFLAYRISPVGKMPSRRLACFPCRSTWPLHILMMHS